MTPLFDGASAAGLIIRLSLLLGVAAIVDRLCTPRHALWNNLLWKAVICGCLVLPMALAVSPKLPISYTSESSVLTTTVDVPGAALRTLPLAKAHAAADLPRDSDAGRVEIASDRVPGVEWQTVLAIVYAAGVVVGLVHLCFGLAFVARLRRRAAGVVSDAWHDELSSASRRLRVRAPVALLQSHEVDAPVQVGVLRPAIILPFGEQATASERAAILTHELCHVQRLDYAFNVIARVAGIVFWFHPLVWYAAARMRTTSELACDDACVAALGRTNQYAESLLRISERLRSGSTPLAASMARPGRVATRIRRISDLGHDVHPIGRAAQASALFVAALLVSLSASVTPEARAAEVVAYPTTLTDEMKGQVDELLEAKAGRLAERIAMSRQHLDSAPAAEVRDRIAAIISTTEAEAAALRDWTDRYLGERDWASASWVERSIASNEYGSLARDAFSARRIELGLYLADRAIQANPLSWHTYNVKYLMLLPRFAVEQRLKAEAIEGIILRDMEAVENLRFEEDMALYNDASQQVEEVKAADLTRLQDGRRGYAYTSLYRWTWKQAYFDSVVAISRRTNVGGQDPQHLFQLAQLTTDPVVSIGYLRRFLENRSSTSHEQMLSARAYQQILTLATEFPDVLEEQEAERYFVSWRAILDRQPLINMPSEQAQYYLVRADYSIACSRSAEDAREWMAAFRVFDRDSLSPMNDQVRGNMDDGDVWVPYENFRAYELILLGDLAALEGDSAAARASHREALERIGPHIDGWNMASEFGIADELKSVRRRLQARLDDPMLEDHFYHL